MSIQTQLRKKLREPGKYAQAVLRWNRFQFDEAPPIFGNAKPKSGSHLLLQILNGFTKIMPYAYTAAEPIRSLTREGRHRMQDEILADLRGLRSGEIGWGYLGPKEAHIDFLCQPGRVNYFIYRDPRDVLVSHVFFATDMHKEHGMHDYYHTLPDFDARLKVAIQGIDEDGVVLSNVYKRSSPILDWLAQPQVMCVRFEDLINNRDATLLSMMNEVEKTGYKIPTLRKKALEILVEAINPKKSHTFRSGKTGGWMKHFSEENKDIFKEISRDLLVRLGYEENNDW